MSSPGRKKGRRASVPDSSSDSRSYGTSQEKDEIMPPSFSFHYSITPSEENSSIGSGNTGHHDIAEPILLPAASSISVLQKASSCPDSSQLRVSPDGQSHGSNVAQMGTPENSPRDSISRIEASTSRPGSCEPARTDQEQPVEFPASSMPSLEMKTKPNPPGSGNTGRESWTFPPRLVPPSSLDHAVAYKAADLVGTAGSTSMSSLDIARERILNRMDSGATAVATNRILSKVNTGGRIRLGKREVSERFLQDLVGSAGEDGGRSTLGKQAETRGECSSKSDKLFADISESMPLEPQIMLLSPPRCVISRENERSFQYYPEFPINFLTWEGMKKYAREGWRSFNNWNNRRTLKKIKASLPILRTYHDALLYGEVPVNLKARTRIRAGWIGFLWHILS